MLNALRKQQEQTQTPNKSASDSFEGSSETSGSDKIEDNSEKFHALLLTVGFFFMCGLPYRAHFKDRIRAKNIDIVAPNQNQIFMQVDVVTRTFLVHCDRCNNNQEIVVDTTASAPAEVAIVCRHCTPVRKGALDVVSGDAVWFG
jgi:hypothetical protein